MPHELTWAIHDLMSVSSFNSWEVKGRKGGERERRKKKRKEKGRRERTNR